MGLHLVSRFLFARGKHLAMVLDANNSRPGLQLNPQNLARSVRYG
jgi:hypothetical protein